MSIQNYRLPGGSLVKNPYAMQEMRVQFQAQEDPVEKQMATHNSILPGKFLKAILFALFFFLQKMHKDFCDSSHWSPSFFWKSSVSFLEDSVSDKINGVLE